MKDDWTQDIRRLMADYRAEAPDGLLDKVKERLTPKEEANVSQGGKGKVLPLWRYRWVAAAAAVAAIAVPVALRLLPDTKRQIAIATNNEAGRNEGLRNSRESTDTLKAVESAAPATTYAKAGTPAVSETPSDSNVVMAQAVTDNAMASSAETSKNADETAENSDRQQPKTTAKVTPRQYYDNLPSYSSKGYDSHDGGQGNHGGLTLTAYYGGTAGSGSAAGARGQMVMYDAPLHPDLNGQDMKHLDAGQKEKAHHRQPIKLGVSVSYRIDSHWSVGTGVTYSYLSSDFTADYTANETQRLHYIGIPLAASYSIVRGRRAELYVTGGGEVEKLVKGSIGQDDYEADKLTESRPQWSVKAAVGGSYHFTPTVSAYAEPGFSYYFDNHSDIVNIYKDRPASFSLNIGIRIDVGGEK